MTDYIGEGLIKCHDCGAMVPSIESLIDLPGAPEHMTPCFRPIMDATMHNPGCGYCHSPEMMEYLNRLLEPGRREDQERRKLTVGELLDSFDGVLNPNITTAELMKVAEIGKELFFGAILTPRTRWTTRSSSSRPTRTGRRWSMPCCGSATARTATYGPAGRGQHRDELARQGSAPRSAGVGRGDLHDGSSFDEERLAKRLGMPVEEVRHHLQALARLGMVEEER